MPDIVEDLTPAQIVEELDRYIVGQQKAKRAVAVALRNRYRRRLLPPDIRDEVIPKNILMIGPTGVGKTEIARRLATLARAPFIKVEATKFTEVGYVGRDVDSMIRDLVQVAMRMVEAEKMAEVQEKAMERAIERIVDILQPLPSAKRRAPKPAEDIAADVRRMFSEWFSGSQAGARPAPPPPTTPSETPQEPSADEERDLKRIERIREVLRQQIASGARDNETITIDVEESQSPPFMQIFSPQGMEEIDLENALGKIMPRRQKQRQVTIAEAKQIFAQQEAHALVDREAVVREAIERTEQSGIIFVDEIDKIASTGRSMQGGPDVSREGVQRDILPIIEGSTVNTKYGPVRTDHILFIAAGAFHVARPSDLIPELQGRLPIRVELESLNEEDYKRILTEPRNALVRQYKALMATEGITVEFTDDAIAEIAKMAAEVNRRSENIGARRLHTIMERVLEDISFRAPDLPEKQITIDAAYVRQRLDDIVQNEDLSRYIL